MFSKKNMIILLRLLFLIAAIALGSYLIVKLFAIVFPFVLGTIFAVIMLPLIKLLEKRLHFPRTLSTIIVLLLFIVIGTSLLTIVSAKIVTELINLAHLLPDYINKFKIVVQDTFTSEYFVDYFNLLNSYYQNLPEDARTNITNTIQNSVPNIVDQAQIFTKAVLSDTVKIVGGIPGTLTILIIALLASFFIARDWNAYISWFRHHMPGVSSKTGLVYAQLEKALVGFVRAQAILVSVTGVIVVIGLLILDVEYAFTIGIASVFLDLLPYLGLGIIMVPWIIYLLIVGNFKLAIGLTILYSIIAVTRQLIEPKILSSSVGTKPLPTLISLYVGLKVLGVFGLILGPITLVILTAFNRAEVFKDIWKMVKE